MLNKYVFSNEIFRIWVWVCDVVKSEEKRRGGREERRGKESREERERLDIPSFIILAKVLPLSYPHGHRYSLVVLVYYVSFNAARAWFLPLPLDEDSGSAIYVGYVVLKDTTPSVYSVVYFGMVYRFACLIILFSGCGWGRGGDWYV